MATLDTSKIRERDPHSFSKPDKVTVRHLDLDLEVDFDSEKIIGRASLHLNPYTEGELVLDTHNLHIQRVTVASSDTDAEYVLGEETEHRGRPLSIRLPTKVDLLHIDYIAAGRAGALQWLRPSQTTGGCHPFLFTQSQTIGARTWVPCQDTPSVRTTYHARIKVPKGLVAVMSAENTIGETTNGLYEFRCSYPIPSYLFALAVGDLEYRALSPRSGVYAERALVSQAAWEFEDIEVMIQAAERIYGPYRWERFNLIVLPPSFPLGGMENPQLVFVTPSLLTGDRSLTSLVAHELAHSWSGNLVTNATWNDFWLNEGFSVYTEHRIMEELYGKEYDDMLVVLSLRSLKKALAVLPSRDTWLNLDLSRRHPDDCFTEIPYEKGYFFLRMLEESVGRELWDRFLNQYFDTFAFQSMTSSLFIAFLREQLFRGDKKLEESLNIDDWIYGPGLPENCPGVYSGELQQVEAKVQAFHNGAPARDLCTDSWTTHHWIYFLTNLEKPVSESKMEDLHKTFRFSETGNAEVIYNWLLLCIAAHYESADFVLEKFLVHQGRLKYVKGLYQELAKTSGGRKKAEGIYRLARSKYHSAVVRAIDGILAS